MYKNYLIYDSYKQPDYYRRQENKIFGKILIDIRDKDDNSLYIILFQLYHII